MFVIETLVTLVIFMCGFIIVPTLRDTRSALSELKEEVIDNEDRIKIHHWLCCLYRNCVRNVLPEPVLGKPYNLVFSLAFYVLTQWRVQQCTKYITPMV